MAVVGWKKVCRRARIALEVLRIESGRECSALLSYLLLHSGTSGHLNLREGAT